MKKIRAVLIPIALAWFMTNAAGCGGDDNQEPVTCTEGNTVKFPEDALDRFYFKEGSYWVYTDSVTHTIYDSVWVYRHTWGASSKKENGHFEDKCYEGGGGYYRTSLSAYHYLLGCSPVFNEENENVPYKEEVFNVELVDIEDGTSFIYRAILQGSDYVTRFTGEITFQDSLEVKANMYKDILKLHYPGQHSDFLNDGYWAKNVGLIKYTDLNGTVWELTKSKTIQ